MGLVGFLGAQVDRVSGLLYIGGRYYDPVTGRYLTPNHGQTNPYAPVQGPGMWLLLPLIGIVVAWKGRKNGPWRMLVLVCVIGFGVTLVSCGGTSPGPEGAPPPPPSQPGQTNPDPNVQLANNSDLIATSVKIFLPPPSFQCPPDDADID